MSLFHLCSACVDEGLHIVDQQARMVPCMLGSDGGSSKHSPSTPTPGRDRCGLGVATCRLIDRCPQVMSDLRDWPIGLDRAKDLAPELRRIPTSQYHSPFKIEWHENQQLASGQPGAHQAPFAEYALTMDLLEDELLDALAAQRTIRPGYLALRDHHLPNLASVLDLTNRLCAGGVPALCAIARPADPYRGEADYALLVQERSGEVINTARRLSVIPKGFHQPLTDAREDAPIGVTLPRKLEDELFGRGETFPTTSDRRIAAPLHPTRLSEPMAWLSAVPGRMRTECTGFGLNLVSGNYEFASLIVIEDDEFWRRYGGHVEANWEASGLRLYSSRDPDLIEELATEENWTNEGLFALLQGLRRLSDLDGGRVELPEIRTSDR